MPKTTILPRIFIFNKNGNIENSNQLIVKSTKQKKTLFKFQTLSKS